jgi:hypothetical protein
VVGPDLSTCNKLHIAGQHRGIDGDVLVAVSNHNPCAWLL